ncbi:MAG: DUF4384 domain-containing protein [Lentisphaerae bacterium]|nr:DUF4384 domain-containing protein [Lentisphaerota bacterium]
MADEVVESDNIKLKWALVRMTASGQEEVLPFTDDIPLLSGQSIKIYLNIQNDQYLYLFLLDSSGNLTTIYPPSDMLGNRTKASQLYIPKDDNWFILDDKIGKETIYIIASSMRQKKLESLIADLSAVTGYKAIRMREKILGEMKSLRRKNSKLAATAEKPISIAGAIRGSGGEVDLQAKQVSTLKFYSKTISIDHR